MWSPLLLEVVHTDLARASARASARARVVPRMTASPPSPSDACVYIVVPQCVSQPDGHDRSPTPRVARLVALRPSFPRVRPYRWVLLRWRDGDDVVGASSCRGSRSMTRSGDSQQGELIVSISGSVSSGWASSSM